MEGVRRLGPVLRRPLLPDLRWLDLGRRLAEPARQQHRPGVRLRGLRRLRCGARNGRYRRPHGAIVLGARIGKYGPDGKPRALAAHSIPMAQLGTFILLFGWFGFNAASTFAATDLRFTVVAVNTAIAAAFGATVAMFYCMKRMGKPDPGMMVNGMLAGLVAITAPCAFVQPWAAALIGTIAAVLIVESCFFFERKGIDDPVGAISVHGVGGVFGVLCVGIFSDGRYGAGWNLTESSSTNGKGVTGILYGSGKLFGSGSFGELGFGQLASQAIGCLVIIFVMGGIVLAFFSNTGGQASASAINCCSCHREGTTPWRPGPVAPRNPPSAAARPRRTAPGTGAARRPDASPGRRRTPRGRGRRGRRRPAAGVVLARDPLDQTVALEPVDEPRDPASGEQHRVGDLAQIPHALVGRICDRQEHLVRRERGAGRGPPSARHRAHARGPRAPAGTCATRPARPASVAPHVPANPAPFAPPAMVVDSTRISAIRNDLCDPATQLVQERRVDAVRHRRLLVAHREPRPLEERTAPRPNSTPITGSRVPCPMAPPPAARPSRSKPATVGMNPERR